MVKRMFQTWNFLSWSTDFDPWICFRYRGGSTYKTSFLGLQILIHGYANDINSSWSTDFDPWTCLRYRGGSTYKTSFLGLQILIHGYANDITSLLMYNSTKKCPDTRKKNHLKTTHTYLKCNTFFSFFQKIRKTTVCHECWKSYSLCIILGVCDQLRQLWSAKTRHWKQHPRTWSMTSSGKTDVNTKCIKLKHPLQPIANKTISNAPCCINFTIHCWIKTCTSLFTDMADGAF